MDISRLGNAEVHGTKESRLRWHTYVGSSVEEDGSGVAVILTHSGDRDRFGYFK